MFVKLTRYLKCMYLFRRVIPNFAPFKIAAFEAGRQIIQQALQS